MQKGDGDCTQCGKFMVSGKGTCLNCYAWACFMCTYINSKNVEVCEICHGNKHDYQKEGQILDPLEDLACGNEVGKERQIERNRSRFIHYTPEKIIRPKQKEEEISDQSKKQSDHSKKGASEEKGQGKGIRERNYFRRQELKKRQSNFNDLKEVDENATTDKGKTSNENGKKTERKSMIELDDYGWNCKLCTYLNEHDRLKCEMCLTSKPDLSRRLPKERLTRKRHLQRGCQSVKIKDREKKEEQEAKKKWMDIVNFCKMGGINFIDDSFKPCDASLFSSPHNHDGSIHWLRCHQIRSSNRAEDKERWCVMKPSPCPEDIEQGELGNCWFLSALAVLAERKDLLEKIVLTKTFCEQGVYQVRLCKDGRWKIVLIDDYFPCTPFNTFKYSKARRKQLWVPIIEKAAAKLHGSYQALISGQSTEALSLLTGQPCERVDLHVRDDGMVKGKEKKDINMEDVWSRLLLFRKLRFLMGASCGVPGNDNRQQYESMGLISNHAYSMMDVQDVQGHRLCKLRNPWGKTSWKGAWSDTSSKWREINPRVKATLQLDGNDKGIFWMELSDLRSYFNSVDICKARTDWHELRVKGTLPPHGGLPWKFVTFTILNTCEMNLGLFQKSFRGEGKTQEPLVDLMIVVLENNTEDNAHLYKRVVANSKRGARSFTGCDVMLNAGMYTVACLAFKHWRSDCKFVTDDDLDKLNEDFVLSIHSSDIIISDEIDTTHPRYHMAIADTLIQLAIDKGKKKELKDGLVTYDLFWYGLVSVVENRSMNLFAQIKLDLTACSYQLPTRGSHITIDCVPPRHRQVIAVMTPFDAGMGWMTAKQFTFVSTQETDLRRFDHPGKQHVPEITRELENLHVPRAM